VGGVARFHQMFAPLLFDVIRIPAPGMFRLPSGVSRESALSHCLRGVREIFQQHHEELAALVIEPLVQGAAGMLTHPPGYLRGVRALCDEFDILLIADEVATGFGRTGKMFACEHEDVSPDLLCLAKGLTGGYMPTAATLATDEIYRAFLGEYCESKTFYHGHTYGGNPLAAAVSLASLDGFEEEHTLDHLQAKIERLREHLARIAQQQHVGDVRQCGFIAGIELVRDRATNQPFPWEEKRGMQACAAALQHGVWLRPLGNVVVIMPPLSTTLEELDRICHAAELGIAAATSYC
jgi:adenosylmethionine-8-amino-7-oxononanoate aminotransferase